MPIYITRVSLTQKGAETLKDSPKRVGQAREWIQKAGGRVIGAVRSGGVVTVQPTQAIVFIAHSHGFSFQRSR